MRGHWFSRETPTVTMLQRRLHYAQAAETTKAAALLQAAEQAT